MTRPPKTPAEFLVPATRRRFRAWTGFGLGLVQRSAGGVALVPAGGREAVLPGPLQRLPQVRGLLCQHDDDLFEVAVGSGPRDAVITGQRLGARAVAEPPQAQHGL